MEYSKAGQIITEVKKAVIGKDEVIAKVLMALLAKGHVLMEDIPGVGKTTLAMAFSKAMSLKQNRIQFTPDVLPSDVTGFSIYNSETHEFEFKEGAIMCNLFLADEINRTSSKTQSALLEVMEEGKVTVDGVTRNVPEPFIVIATQNPVGSIGTQMLPESQLDRFMIKLSMGYPDLKSEINILMGKQNNNPLDSVIPVANLQDILRMQKEVEKIYVDPRIYEYISMLIALTRKHPHIELGVSPRGSIALACMARARAYMYGRSYVISEDVRAVFTDVTGHRIILSPKARINRTTIETVVDSIFNTVPVPSIN